jgi:hypothetical protein
MHLVPNQTIYLILPGETIDNMILVLPNPLDQIRCNTCIQSAISSARKQVYAGLLAHFAILGDYVIPAQAGIQLGLSKSPSHVRQSRNLFNWLDSGLRRNDG